MTMAARRWRNSWPSITWRAAPSRRPRHSAEPLLTSCGSEAESLHLPAKLARFGHLFLLTAAALFRLRVNHRQRHCLLAFLEVAAGDESVKGTMDVPRVFPGPRRSVPAARSCAASPQLGPCRTRAVGSAYRPTIVARGKSRPE